MRPKPEKIGILGGTFNPVHFGHLEMSRRARELFVLDRVIFIPVFSPPHKEEKDLASSSHRQEMLRLALQGEEGCEVSDMEIRRGGRSYTVETVEETLKNRSRPAEIFVIIGVDNLEGISTWKRINDLVEMARFIVFTRPGEDLRRLKEEDRNWVERILAADRSNLVELSLPVSSSAIRAAVAEGRDISRMVPGMVGEYIRRKGLYKSSDQ